MTSQPTTFLKAPPSATLDVQLRSCRDLADVATLGRQHPYCVLTWGPHNPQPQRFRTLTHTQGGKNPEWNQTFTFTGVTSMYPLRLEFFDESMVLRDKAIGEVKITMNKILRANGSIELEEPVLRNGKQAGTCLLTLTVKGLKDSAAKPAPKPAQQTQQAQQAPQPQRQQQAKQAQQPQSSEQAKQAQQPAKAAQPVKEVAGEKEKEKETPAPKPKFAAGMLPAASGHVPSKFILPTYADTNCWEHYERGKLLGKGNFGKTYLAIHRATGREYAVKVINKRMLSSLEAIQDVRNEVEVLHHLAGHPNVVNLEQVYEDKQDVCLVMELMRGGELFDAIAKRGIFTERQAAALIRDVVSVVAKCHAESVIHRDIKPENFLLTDTGPEAKLKAADFGLSSFFTENQVFTDIVGSLYYMAPEVLRREYSREADIWSCGIILYILLSGRPPFGSGGKNEAEVFAAIKSEALDLASEPWDQISEAAKDCIRKMLKRDPKHRARAREILNHDWLRENGCATENVIEVGVITRMKQFNQGNKLKKAVTQMMVSKLPLDEINGLREIFKAMDKRHTGRVTLKEFADALKQMGTKLPEADLRAMWKEIDQDGDGTLLYEEFLAATIHQSKLEREDRMKAAFHRFDTDGNGFIGPQELRQGLKEANIHADDIEDIIRQIDRDGDGYIDYNEFCMIMRQHE